MASLNLLLYRHTVVAPTSGFKYVRFKSQTSSAEPKTDPQVASGRSLKATLVSTVQVMSTTGPCCEVLQFYIRDFNSNAESVFIKDVNSNAENVEEPHH
ncbi:hypothetical protein INR49_027822 [Caranx melampygus]|nr:hypothetical protein INR49_027822 [Caranx melampygus]